MAPLHFTFKYHGDAIVAYPFIFFRNFFRMFEEPCFFSTSYGEYFKCFPDYWMMVGKKSALIEILQRKKSMIVQGFKWEEVLAKFTRSEYPNQPVVVLYDLEVNGLIRLIEKLPGATIKTFMESVVCISAKSREDAKKIVAAIPNSIGEAFAVQDGTILSRQEDSGFTGWSNS